MFDRHLVTDVALAAAIVLPAALPPTATPRASDTHLVSPAPSPALAQQSGGLHSGRGDPLQRQS